LKRAIWAFEKVHISLFRFMFTPNFSTHFTCGLFVSTFSKPHTMHFRNFRVFNPNMKRTALVGIFVVLAVIANAQTGRYLVQLRDKAQNPYSLANPAQFLSARSIARRARYHLAYDNTDLPVTPAYIDSIKSVASVTVLNVSKWLNQISIQTTDAAALAKINAFPFVQGATFIASRNPRENTGPENVMPNTKSASGIQSATTVTQQYDYGAAAAQVAIHNGSFLHEIGLQGQGMILSLLDAGFYQYTSLKAFDSVNLAGQVLGTWDFVAREASVAEDNQHGMYCFSIIAANIPGAFVGTAPKASFYLFRTEDDASEYPIEEHNWVCAAERVDSAGGDVISSSLGYSTFTNPVLNHLYSDLDGDKTMAATGADLAAKKGLLVVVAAGNEGDKPWKYIMTPADGDSVLAVGAVNTRGEIASFSSYGPSADGRVKPDVASVGAGTVIQSTANTVATGNGTSFACPNMAGLATCLWQGFPEYDNMKIIEVLRRSGNRFQSPDNRTGYGIPDVKKAMQLLLEAYATAAVSDCKTITWTSKDVSSMHYEIERQKRDETSFTKIGVQSGTGSVFQNHTYQFADPDITVADGTVRYRIRQVMDTAANSAAAFYIDTVTVALSLTCTPVPASESGIQLIPNPVHNTLYLKMETGSAIPDLQLQIVNAIGQTVYTERTVKPSSGLAVFSVTTAGLARGVYYLTVYEGSKRIATKSFTKL